jgi:hypothetical protein
MTYRRALKPEGRPGTKLPTLESLVSENPNGPPTLELALQVGVQLVVALHERGLRGERALRLRPSNILLAPNGNILFIEGRAATPRVTSAQEFFDLGRILHFLLTGQLPDDTEARQGPARLNARVDGLLDLLILTMLRGRLPERPNELAPIFNGLVKALNRLWRRPSLGVVAAWVRASTPADPPDEAPLRAVPVFQGYANPDLNEEPDAPVFPMVKSDSLIASRVAVS